MFFFCFIFFTFKSTYFDIKYNYTIIIMGLRWKMVSNVTIFALKRGQRLIHVEIQRNLLLEGSLRYDIMSISEKNMHTYLTSSE